MAGFQGVSQDTKEITTLGRGGTDATAVALAYTEDAASAKHASFKPGSLCSNCQFYTGAPDAARGPCTLFAGYSVAAKGWCSAWAKKA